MEGNIMPSSSHVPVYKIDIPEIPNPEKNYLYWYDTTNRWLVCDIFSKLYEIVYNYFTNNIMK